MAVKEYKITTGDAIFPDGHIVLGHITAVEPVSREHLEQAVNLTAERLPFIRTEITEHDGCLWLRENGKPFVVPEGTEPPKPGDENANGHPVSWSCQGNVLYFRYDHRLCDGHGYAMISRLVQYHYCCLHYGKKPAFQSMIRPDEPFREEEYADPFSYIGDTQSAGRANAFASFAPPVDDFKTLRLRAPLDKFMAAAKQLGASPSSLSVILLCSVLDSLYPEKDAPITFSSAVDFRNILGCPNTVQNSLVFSLFSYTEDIKARSLAGQIAAFRAALKEQREPDNMRAIAADLRRRYEQKIQARRTGRFEPIAPPELFKMTYVGQVDRGEIEQYFTALTMDSDPRSEPHLLAIVQQNDCFFFDFIGMPKPEELLAGFRQKLLELDIPSEVIE